MELLYLIASIIYNTLLSFTLSLFLPFQYIHHFLQTQPKSSIPKEPNQENNPNPELTLYEGIVWHQRMRPVRHSFRYRARYALIDLDRAPNTIHNHLSAHQAREITSTNRPVYVISVSSGVHKQIFLSYAN
ncbi:hypothetical protein ACHQM5_004446 [Ranunculus cassubicifolius]